jgi:azobenzene reductase
VRGRDDAWTPRPVLILAGAATPGSRTRWVADLVTRRLRAAGASDRLWDLAETPLPPRGGGDAAPEAAAVKELRVWAATAGALVWVTPCYHGSYSGVLKNALDHLCVDEIAGKPVGLISVGASLTAVQACEHLRAVARTLGCVCVPTQSVVTGSGHRGDTPSLHTADNRDVIVRIDRMIHELGALAGATAALRGPSRHLPLGHDYERESAC